MLTSQSRPFGESNFLPSSNLESNPLLRLHYVGDVARVTIGDKFIVDDFYNGDVARNRASALRYRVA